MPTPSPSPACPCPGRPPSRPHLHCAPTPLLVAATQPPRKGARRRQTTREVAWTAVGGRKEILFFLRKKIWLSDYIPQSNSGRRQEICLQEIFLAWHPGYSIQYIYICDINFQLKVTMHPRFNNSSRSKLTILEF